VTDALATTPPAAAEPTSLLGALNQTLVELHAAALGAPGEKVRTLERRTGAVAHVVRRGLSLIVELIAALARGIAAASDLILGADAVFALVEVVLDTLDAMVEAVGGVVTHIGKSGGAQGGDADAGVPALAAVRGPIGEAQKFLADDGVVADLMPSPAELAAVRKQLALLLGARADPRATGLGSLGELADAIAPGGPTRPSATPRGAANAPAGGEPDGTPQGS
jgi:hypothetical protein